jgi:hypothetical protein
MKVIKKIILAFGILIFSLNSFSQNNDTIPKGVQESKILPLEAAAFVAEKIPSTRAFNLEFTNTSPYNFTTEKGGDTSQEGKVKRFSQIKMSTNVDFIKKKNWLLSTTLGYNYTSMKADIILPSSTGINTVDHGFHSFYAGGNFTYLSTLFHKRTIFTAGIMLEGSEKYIEKVRGLLMGTMILKANERTKMSVGVAVNIDAHAQIPVIPTFSYEHKFANRLTVDMILPRYVYIRKYIFGNGKISLGSEMDQTAFYLYNIDGTNQKYQYSQLDINSGLVYEHLIAKRFIFTAKTGIRSTPSGRLYKKNSYSDPVFKVNADPTFYFNAGISFDPFKLMKSKKK